MSGFKNSYDEAFYAELKYNFWIYARTKHLKCNIDDFYDHPEWISMYVPDDYCGANFDEDSTVDLPKDCSEEILKAYRDGYNRGYHRGVDRIKP